MAEVPESFVSLNGIDLKEGVDFHWLQGKLVLHRPRPIPYKKDGLWNRIAYWFRPPYAPPDMVAVENWGDAFRAVYFSGTAEFTAHVCYEEDLDHDQGAKTTHSR